MRGWKQWNGMEKASAILAAIGVVGALFLPWATVLGATIYGFQGDGWIMTILFALTLIPLLLAKRWGWWLALAGGVLNAFLAVDKISAVSSTGFAAAGVGLMVVLAAGVGLAVTSVLAWRQTGTTTATAVPPRATPPESPR